MARASSPMSDAQHRTLVRKAIAHAEMVAADDDAAFVRPCGEGQGLPRLCVAVGNDQQWGCTGTLVARNVVLTAGHCASFATRVFFGRDVSKTGPVVRVRRRVRHLDYLAGHG